VLLAQQTVEVILYHTQLQQLVTQLHFQQLVVETIQIVCGQILLVPQFASDALQTILWFKLIPHSPNSTQLLYNSQQLVVHVFHYQVIAVQVLLHHLPQQLQHVLNVIQDLVYNGILQLLHGHVTHV